MLGIFSKHYYLNVSWTNNFLVYFIFSLYAPLKFYAEPLAGGGNMNHQPDVKMFHLIYALLVIPTCYTHTPHVSKLHLTFSMQVV